MVNAELGTTWREEKKKKEKRKKKLCNFEKEMIVIVFGLGLKSGAKELKRHTGLPQGNTKMSFCCNIDSKSSVVFQATKIKLKFKNNSDTKAKMFTTLFFSLFYFKFLIRFAIWLKLQNSIC